MSYIAKFGHSEVIGTVMTPVTTLGAYRTPQVAGATQLRIKAGGNAADSATGAGARRIALQGLDATGKPIIAYVTTNANGTLASDPTSLSFLRLFRFWVDKSGTYAGFGAGSMVGPITIENAAGTLDWGIMSTHDGAFPTSQSEVAAYSIPAGYVGRIHSYSLTVSGNKAATAALVTRENILETVPPYTAMRVKQTFTAIPPGGEVRFLSARGGREIQIPPLSDIGWMATVAAGTGEVSARLNIELVPEGTP